MKIVNTEIVEIDGVKYQIDTYDTGAVVKYPWTDPDAPQPEPEPQPTPTPSITMEELNQNQLTIMEALTDLYSTIADMGA